MLRAVTWRFLPPMAGAAPRSLCFTVLLTWLQNAENEMSIIAAYYGLPTLSMRLSLIHI